MEPECHADTRVKKRQSSALARKRGNISFQIDVAEIDERAVETAFVEQGGAGDGLASTLARAKAIELAVAIRARFASARIKR